MSPPACRRVKDKLNRADWRRRSRWKRTGISQLDEVYYLHLKLIGRTVSDRVDTRVLLAEAVVRNHVIY